MFSDFLAKANHLWRWKDSTWPTLVKESFYKSSAFPSARSSRGVTRLVLSWGVLNPEGLLTQTSDLDVSISHRRLPPNTSELRAVNTSLARSLAPWGKTSPHPFYQGIALRGDLYFNSILYMFIKIQTSITVRACLGVQ